ncbi:MAG: hypothetical protein Q9170_001581 [Blastenia crenularia]
MPSWPARLLHGPAPENSLQSTEASPSPLMKSGCDVDAPVVEPTQPGIHARQSPDQTRRHGRSYSHPLTSLFGKRTKDVGQDRVGTDNDTQSPQLSPISCLPPDTLGKSSNGLADGFRSRNKDSELRSGRCATCDSTVRWPKQLSVFRCTVCLMVNDLRPSDVRRQGNLEDQDDQKPRTLSLIATEKLINDCVLLYLQSSLNPENRSLAEGAPLLPANQSTSLDRRSNRGNDVINDSLEKKDMSVPRVNLICTSNMQIYEDRGQELKPPVLPLSKSVPSTIAPAGFSPGLPVDALLPVLGSPPSRFCSNSQQSPGPKTSEGPHQERFTTHTIFRSLEDYIVQCFGSCETLNESFLLRRHAASKRSVSEGVMTVLRDTPKPSDHENVFELELDAKTLLLGDVAENGAWWLGKTFSYPASPQSLCTTPPKGTTPHVGSKSPRTDWDQLHRWYQVVTNAGCNWRNLIRDRPSEPWASDLFSAQHEAQIQGDIAASCKHLHRTLLKATETLLRRPGRPIKSWKDCRFLLLLLQNPLLYPVRPVKIEDDHVKNREPDQSAVLGESYNYLCSFAKPGRGASRNHTGIAKRLLGLMANLPQENHRYLISWFARYTDDDFRMLVDFVGGFVTHRLMRQRRSRLSSQTLGSTPVLVPDVVGFAAGTSAQLHTALGIRTQPSGHGALHGNTVYHDDWQIKAAAKVMSLLFQANNARGLRGCLTSEEHGFRSARCLSAHQYRSAQSRYGVKGLGNATEQTAPPRAPKHKRMLPTSAFYNTLLDYCDLVTDFNSWENHQRSFSFCQYPMFLSIWAKIRILEHDARRQMEIRARQAFFNSIMSRRAVSQYLVVKVRRDCLVEDSLRGVSEVIGSGPEDIKKSLRIAFQGEEGIDAGGLRKEWFLLLVREVFDPEHGLFVYDDESHYCYFNPNTFETSDQFFLVGVVLGLAIYNSTILDIALPPFAFRKLLASAPSYAGPTTSMARPDTSPTLADLAEFRPALALGLRRLLEFEGDVQQTICRDFVADVECYGQPVQVPLCPHGEGKAVTNSNRVEFVDLYVKYLLDTSVSRQFEPFKRGFFSVCGGNALSLFRPEEIELLIRGSDEPLDVATLRAVAIYDGWKNGEVAGDEAVITWFWELFMEATSREQRALLSFITGSDRLPAMGATSLIIKLTCLGDESTRFPIARTCFNMIGLHRYSSKHILKEKLWTAVAESEGFGLK